MGKVRSAFILVASFCLAGICHVPSVAAASNPVLDEIVVTDSRIEEKKKFVATSITTINAEDLKQSAARNLGELLAEKSVGHIQRYPGSNTSIGVRAFKTDSHGNDLKGHVLVLINGRRAGSGNVAKILTKNIERIEILRGPGAVQYGSAGMGGVVNVITRQGDKNGASVDIGYGSFDEVKAGMSATARKGAFDFSGAIEYRTHDDYKTGDGERYKNTGLDSQVSYSLNGGYTLFPNNRVALVLNGVNVDEAGNPGYLSQNDLDNYTDQKNMSGDLIYQGSDTSGKWSWLVRYFRGTDKDEWFDPTESNASGWDDGIPSERDTDQR